MSGPRRGKIAHGKGDAASGAGRPVAPNEADLRAEVRRCLAGYELNWTYSDAPERLSPMMDQAARLLKERQAEAAIAVLTAVADPMALDYESYEGECEVYEFLAGEVVPMLTIAVLAADLDPESKAELRARIKAYDAELENYGGAMFYVVLEALEIGLTGAGEAGASWGQRHAGAGWQMYMPTLAEIQLAALQIRGDDQGFIDRAREEGRHYPHALKLIELSRLDEARAVIEQMDDYEDLQALAQRLAKAGHTDATSDLGERLLEVFPPPERSRQPYDPALLNWLARIAEPGRPQLARRAWLAAFDYWPSPEAYAALQRLTEPASWPAQHVALVESAMQNPSVVAAIELLLDIGEIDRAIVRVESVPLDERSLALVCDFAAIPRPDWVIAQCLPRAEKLMAAGKSKDYELAYGWLRCAGRAFETAGRHDAWSDYLDQQIARHRRKYSLVPHLEALKQAVGG